MTWGEFQGWCAVTARVDAAKREQQLSDAFLVSPRGPLDDLNATLKRLRHGD